MKSSDIRLKARESLTGNYWPAVLAALVAGFFGALITSGGTLDVNWEEPVSTLFTELPTVILVVLAIVGTTVGILSLVTFILGGVIQLGYAQYLLKQQDKEINSISDLFSQFDRFGQGFLQAFLRGLFTALWSLLFIIPGIVKAFAYAMTPFLMAEDPSLTAMQAIKLSQEKMKGHKWELFCLSFSFIGWHLLAGLTAGIGYIFLNPYTNAAYAAFYRDKIAQKVASFAYVTNELQG